MALTDYVVKLRAQDELTGIIKNLGKQIRDTGAAASRLDDIQKEFKRIAESTAPAKRQLRDIQKLLGEMNLRHLEGTPVFLEMSQYAGNLADALGDARQAVNAFANDQFKLEAMAQGISGFAAAGTTATGILELLGIENKKFEEAIKKVQSSLALLNGVQQISVLLNKDSALMLRIRQLRALGAAAATSTDAAAIGANTAAQGANTVATTLAMKARQKLNYTIAVGKALMGDWTGLVLIGAAALATYAIASSDSSDKIEKESDTLKKAQEDREKLNSSIASSTAKNVAKFIELKEAYSKLRSEAQKTKWIDENKSALHELGLKVKSLTDADSVFISNSDKVVEAFKLRAQAAALAQLQVEEYEKYYRKIIDADSSVEGGGKFNKRLSPMSLSVSSAANIPEEWKKAGLKEGLDYTFEWSGGQSGSGWVKTMQSGLDKINDYRLKKARETNQKLHREAEKELNENIGGISKQVDKTKKAFDRLNLGATVPFTPEIKDREVPKSETRKKKDGIVDEGSLKYAQDQLKKFQDERIKIPIDSTESLNENQKNIEHWEKEVESRKILLQISPVYDEDRLNSMIFDDSSLKGLQEHLRQLEDFRRHISPDDEALANTLEEEIKKVKKKVEATEVKLGLKPRIDEGSLEAVEKEISRISGEMKNISPELNPRKFNELKEKLRTLLGLKEELEKDVSLEISPSIHFDAEKLEKGSLEDLRRSYGNAMGKINEIGSDFSKGLINKEEAESQVKGIVEQLQALIPDLEIKVKVSDDGSIDVIRQGSVSLESALGNVGSAVNTLGVSMQNLANDSAGLAKAAAVAQAVGTLVLTFAQSMKGSISVWDWIAGAVAGVATLTSVVSQLQSFAEGGIVQGSSYSGDRLLVRANAGEMILNRAQQSNLYNAIRSNSLGTPTMAGTVRFEIDGPKLVGVLDNYNAKLRRQS